MKNLKTLLVIVVALAVVFALVACNPTGNSPIGGDNSNSIVGGGTSGSGTENPPSVGDEDKDDVNGGDNVGDVDNGNNSDNGDNTGDNNAPDDNDNVSGGEDNSGNDKPEVEKNKVLIVYFSCTNTTQRRAEQLKDKFGDKADIYRINPAEPYTSADLNYSNSSCRANREQNDPNARPQISGRIDNMEQYDTIFIGYPIWWGIAPKIIYTFIESYDFTGKTIIPFCTSGGSSMGNSATNLHSLAPNAVWKTGCRITRDSDIDTLVGMM